MVLFRCDMVLLLAPMVLATLLSGEAKLVPTAATGIMSSLLALALTVFVDSYFWKRYLPRPIQFPRIILTEPIGCNIF